MAEFLIKNFEYTDSTSFYQEYQKLFSAFVINEDGSISNTKILSGQKKTGKEMLRVISIMPKWITGEVKGVK